MKKEVKRLLTSPLSEENIDKICEICKIKRFQIKKIYKIYNNSDETTKKIIINNVIDGKYSTEERIYEDYKNEVINALENDVEELCELCGISYDRAEKLFNDYSNLSMEEFKIIEEGKEATDIVRERWKIIRELVEEFDI